MGHINCPAHKITKCFVLCTRDVTISCYGLAHISCVQVNFELLSTYWVKKLGANQAVCAFCFHAQWCILKREVVSVYFVTTINTKKKLSESRIHKNGQKCVGFFLCVCECVFITVQTVLYIRKFADDQFTKNLLPKFQVIVNTVKHVWAYFCRIGPFNYISLYESLLQPWYNPLWLTGLKAPTNYFVG